ncbi:MAG: hypothetical protein KC912_05070 [Proteobacteria bacterium]|nr:hypothetical protein [Pseudomonadota bacterium]
MTRALVTLSLLLVACNGDDLEAPGPANDGCGDTPPVIDLLTIELGDELQGSGDATYNSVRLTANVSDADFDLHWYTMRVWYDEDEDVSASMEGEYLEITGEAGTAECETQAAVLRMQVGVTGNPPEDTDLYWTVMVYDDQDTPSDPETQLFATPPDPAR